MIHSLQHVALLGVHDTIAALHTTYWVATPGTHTAAIYNLQMYDITTIRRALFPALPAGSQDTLVG